MHGSKKAVFYVHDQGSDVPGPETVQLGLFYDVKNLTMAISLWNDRKYASTFKFVFFRSRFRYYLYILAFEGCNHISSASIDITAVVDISGSMEGDKLNLVKESLKFVVGQLADSDSLGIVTYGKFPKSEISAEISASHISRTGLIASFQLRSRGVPSSLAAQA